MGCVCVFIALCKILRSQLPVFTFFFSEFLFGFVSSFVLNSILLTHFFGFFVLVLIRSLSFFLSFALSSLTASRCYSIFCFYLAFFLCCLFAVKTCLIVSMAFV